MKKVIPSDAVLVPNQAERVFKGMIFDVYQWPQKFFDGTEGTFEMLKRPDTVSVICVVDDKILVIDDEQDIQDALKMILDYEGYRHIAALTGKDGLKLIEEEHPDVIFLDMTMRNFDRTMTEDGGRQHAFAGREILRQMQRHGVSSATIVVTHFDRFGEEE